MSHQNKPKPTYSHVVKQSAHIARTLLILGLALLLALIINGIIR